MTKRKPTVKAEDAPAMTLAQKLSCVAWEACRAWDAVNGIGTLEWSEVDAGTRSVFTAHVAVMLDRREAVAMFPSDRWEESVKDGIVRAIVSVAL